MHPLPASRALLFALLGLAASPAAAGTLASASWLTDLTGYAGTVGVAVPVVATGSSTDSALNVSLTLPAFEHASIHAPGPPLSFPIFTYRRLELGGAQAIAATAGMASADTALPGHAYFHVAAHAKAGPNASMTVAQTLLFAFPLRVGVDDDATGYFYTANSLHYITVDFYAWTAGTHTFTGLTQKGVALPSAKAAGSFALTAQGGGTVTLVAPARITIDSTGSAQIAQQRTVSVTTLKLTFVPEPSGALLLGAAGLASALVLRGRAA